VVTGKTNPGGCPPWRIIALEAGEAASCRSAQASLHSSGPCPAARLCQLTGRAHLQLAHLQQLQACARRQPFCRAGRASSAVAGPLASAQRESAAARWSVDFALPRASSRVRRAELKACWESAGRGRSAGTGAIDPALRAARGGEGGRNRRLRRDQGLAPRGSGSLAARSDQPQATPRPAPP